MALMGLDIGSTGCKCAIFSNDGELLTHKYHEYARSAGSTEFDGAAIWEYLCEMIPEAISGCGDTVSAVCVTSLGEAVAPIGSDGNPLMPFMQSVDQRGEKYITRLDRDLKDHIRDVTGLNPLSRFSLSKMIYVCKEEPRVFEKIWKYMLMGDFIQFKLCGRAVSDYSLSYRTAAFSLNTYGFDDRILAAAGIDSSKMCSVVPPCTVIGTVLPETASRLGFPPGTPVVTGGHDTVPENFCTGLIGEGVAGNGCGTAEGLAVVRKTGTFDPKTLTRYNFSCEPYLKKDHQLIYGINASSGNLMKWYRDQFFTAEHRKALEDGGSIYRLLDEKAPAKPTGLLVIPHFTGSSTPEYSTLTHGTITGLTLSTTPLDIYRALMEGTAYELRYIAEKLKECGIPINEVRASGGGSRSDIWLQIKADVLGAAFSSLEFSDTSVTGCAMMAGVATGVYPDLETAVGIFVKPGKKFSPAAENHEYYLRMFERYKKIRSSMLDIWSN